MGGVGVELGKMGVLLIAKKVNLKRSHQKKKGSLPWWLHGKESSWNAGDVSSIPEAGRCHMQQGNHAREPQLLSLCPRAREPQLWRPHGTATTACTPWSRSCSAREATALRRLCATPREGPRLAATRGKPAQQRKPSTAINKQIQFKRKCHANYATGWRWKLILWW